jgi:hypothetical protein
MGPLGTSDWSERRSRRWSPAEDESVAALQADRQSWRRWRRSNHEHGQRCVPVAPERMQSSHTSDYPQCALAARGPAHHDVGRTPEARQTNAGPVVRDHAGCSVVTSRLSHGMPLFDTRAPTARGAPCSVLFKVCCPGRQQCPSRPRHRDSEGAFAKGEGIGAFAKALALGHACRGCRARGRLADAEAKLPRYCAAVSEGAPLAAALRTRPCPPIPIMRWLR